MLSIKINSFRSYTGDKQVYCNRTLDFFASTNFVHRMIKIMAISISTFLNQQTDGQQNIFEHVCISNSRFFFRCYVGCKFTYFDFSISFFFVFFLFFYIERFSAYKISVYRIFLKCLNSKKIKLRDIWVITFMLFETNAFFGSFDKFKIYQLFITIRMPIHMLSKSRKSSPKLS